MINRKTPLYAAMGLALAGGQLAFHSSQAASESVSQLPAGESRFLTEPYLQNPGKNSVSVVWITNFAGQKHTVLVEQPRNGKNKSHGLARVRAETVKLERLFEDAGSRLENPPSEVMQRQVYRHEAVVKGLQAELLDPQ